MGIEYIDTFTVQHLVGGLLSQTLLNSVGVSTRANFIISNGVHTFIECIEHNVSPTGKKLESTRNHVTDIIVFLLGWIISFYFQIDIPEPFRTVACIILMLATVKEIGREIFPYSCIGAFRD